VEFADLVHAPPRMIAASGVHAQLAAHARRMLREPMVVFAAIGAALFALASAIDAPADRTIAVTPAEVAAIAANWRAQAQRPPTARELTALIDERIDEEVLYREAVRRGLDRDDVIVRRRLAQKLAFLNDDLSAPPPPSEAELQRYFAANATRYAAPDVFTFKQVYFSPERRGASAEDAARAVLAQLAGAGEGASADALGDPFMLATHILDASTGDIARDYGPAFADALRTLPRGRWSGPIASAYGLHLVRIEARRGAYAPPYAQVATKVREDFIAEQRRAANAAWVAKLRSRYRIERPPASP
jgi:peptidyl-prolyl cis-trans isomerase C